MSQPPPTPAPFDHPAQYLRFRFNFGDQVERKISLSDSEKMNYLLAYTTGKAQRIIENYQGLPVYKLTFYVLKRSSKNRPLRVKDFEPSSSNLFKINIIMLSWA